MDEIQVCHDWEHYKESFIQFRYWRLLSVIISRLAKYVVKQVYHAHREEKVMATSSDGGNQLRTFARFVFC